MPRIGRTDTREMRINLRMKLQHLDPPIFQEGGRRRQDKLLLLLQWFFCVFFFLPLRLFI